MGYFIAWLIFYSGFSYWIANYASSKKRRNQARWFFISFFITPPLAFIILLFLKPTPRSLKKCPKCGEIVKIEAMTCQYCRYDFSDDEVRAEKEKQKEPLRSEKEVLNYLCDICSISIPSKSSGTFFDANRVLTSPSYWERLSIKGHSLGKLDEETLAMYLKMKMNKKRDPSGYTVCEKCRDMLKMDRQKAKDYGLDAVCKFPIPYSIPTGHIDMNAVVLVVGIIWEKIHGSWPSTIDRTLKGK